MYSGLFSFLIISFFSLSWCQGIHESNFCGYIPTRNERMLGYVFGGMNAAPNIHKWIAYVKVERPISAECGGTLISDNAVLTAAHCLCNGDERRHARDVWIYLGVTDITKLAGDEVIRLAASEIKIHPSYNHNYKTRGNLVNDVAILFLERRIEWGQHPNIRPICLPPLGYSVHSNYTAILAGWGYMKGNVARGNHLQTGNLTVYQDDYCRTKFPSHHWDSLSMICAGSPIGVDSCQGDSGGPLIAKIPDSSQYELVGIVSWGYGQCDGTQTESVYVNVMRFIPWIHETISSNDSNICEEELEQVRREKSNLVKNLRDRDTALNQVKAEKDQLARILKSKDTGTFTSYTSPKSWHDAKAHCKSLGGDLATIRSENDMKKIASLNGENLWIGANDIAAEGSWVWPDGSEVIISRWAPGTSKYSQQPDNYRGQDCALTNWDWAPRREYWDDEDCNEKKGYVCQIIN